MSLEAVTPLLLFVLASAISPGGATTLATASGANFGLRRSVPLIAGIAAGIASMAALAAAGLAGILLAAPSLQLAMKAAGSLYLLWLAWRTATSGAPRAGTGAGAAAAAAAAAAAEPTSFAGGVGLLWLNPKAWAVTMAAAASFADLASGPAGLALLLGATFGLCATLSLSLWCIAGLLLARTLRTEAQWRALNVALGALLAASVVPIWL